MICIKCRQEIRDGVMFCPQCGAKQELAEEKKSEEKRIEEKTTKGKTGLIIGIAAAVTALLLVVGVVLGIFPFILKDKTKSGDSLLADLGKDSASEEEVQMEEESTPPLSAEEYPVYFKIFAANEAITDENGNLISNPLTDAEIDIRKGSGAREGAVLVNAGASEDGSISVNLIPGIYTAEILHPDYLTGYVEVEVKEGETSCNGWVIPTPEENQTAVILAWDGADTDLDLTIFTPDQSTDGDMAHIGRGTTSDNKGNFLVSDNKSGCEVIYLNTADAGSYRIFVNDYTNSSVGNYTADRLGTENTHIYIYNNMGYVADYAYPLAQNGVVWEVAEINQSTVTPSQKVDYEPTEGSWWIVKKGKKYLKSEFSTPYLSGTTYYYDLKGNVIADAQLGSFNEYTYDERGNILSETFYSNLEFVRKTEYTYDENGNKILVKYYDSEGEDCHRWTEYTYDSHGNMTSSIYQTSDATFYGEGDGADYSYEYDDRGNILVKRVGSGVGVDDYEIRYTYDDAGNVLSEEWYDYPDTFSSMKKYAYDENGNILTIHTFYITRDNLNDWVEYTYDDRRNVLSEKWTYVQSGGNRTVEYRNTYDNEGNIIEKVEASSVCVRNI